MTFARPAPDGSIVQCWNGSSATVAGLCSASEREMLCPYGRTGSPWIHGPAAVSVSEVSPRLWLDRELHLSCTSCCCFTPPIFNGSDHFLRAGDDWDVAGSGNNHQLGAGNRVGSHLRARKRDDGVELSVDDESRQSNCSEVVSRGDRAS